MSNVPESRAAKAIREAMETGRPLVYVRSAEEQRVARILAEVSRRSGGAPVWTWSLTEGLPRDEARYAVRRAIASGHPLGPESIPALLEEKKLLVNRSGVIEFISDGTNLSEVGGLEGLKRWLLERRKLFQMREDLDAEIVP